VLQGIFYLSNKTKAKLRAMKENIIFYSVLALFLGAISYTILKKDTPKKQLQNYDEGYDENYGGGIIDGGSKLIGSAMFLVVIVIGMILVFVMVAVKKAADNPDKAFTYAERGAGLYKTVKGK
jgi:hypothetical protein